MIAIPVEAIRFYEDTDELPFQEDSVCCLGPEGWYIMTALNTELHIKDGDWIIKFSDGYYTACSHDEFYKGYSNLSEGGG